MLLNNDHGPELLHGKALSFLLDVDNVSGGNNLILRDTLDGHTNRVTGSCGIENLLVLLDGEHLLVLKSRRSNSNYVTRTESSLLNSSADNLSNSLDIVNSRDGKTKGKIGETGRRDDEVIQSLKEGESSNLDLGLHVSLPSLVPGALIRLDGEVVTVESRVRNEGNLLGLVPNQLKHLLELFLDLIETALVPLASVHLVDSNNDLLNSKKVKKTSVLTGLSLLDSHLGVSLGDSSLETSLLCRDKKKTNISGSRSGNHILDVILMAGSIYNGVVVLIGEELLGVTLDGNSTLTLLLTGIKVVSESEGRLSLLLSHCLKLGHLTLGNSAALEDKVTTGGGLSCIYVTADDNR
mmetsp:Transcript_1883/g.2849  ORF Transcript_1883/g.2849 Transcript_1883/m.2849 type:complete len:352 (+) Transcript_1883:416-1471(+)